MNAPQNARMAILALARAPPESDRALDVLQGYYTVAQDVALLKEVELAVLAELPGESPDSRHGISPILVAQGDKVIRGQCSGDFRRAECLGWLSVLQEEQQLLLQHVVAGDAVSVAVSVHVMSCHVMPCSTTLLPAISG